MKNVERLLQEQKKGQQKKKRESENEWPDDMEMTMELPHQRAMNSGESIFNRTLEARRGGINTAPSVFAKGTVFQTKTGEE